MSGNSENNNSETTRKRRIRSKSKKTRKTSNCGSGKKKTKNLPSEIISETELKSFTSENSFLLNPAIPNAIFNKDIIFSQERAESARGLHEHLFSMETLSKLDDKTLVSLYAIAIGDINRSRALNMKLAETSEKSRWYKEVAKFYQDIEKQKILSSSPEQSRSQELIQSLLSETMRHNMEDELEQKYGGSNSFKPIENRDYEIVTIDPDADD